MIKRGDSMNYLIAKLHTRGTISPPRRKKKKRPKHAQFVSNHGRPDVSKIALSIRDKHCRPSCIHSRTVPE